MTPKLQQASPGELIELLRATPIPPSAKHLVEIIVKGDINCEDEERVIKNHHGEIKTVDEEPRR